MKLAPLARICRVVANRRYLRARRKAFPGYGVRGPDPRYHSQWGQDQFVAEHFGFKRGGFFVDIGASDGVTFSNTLFLERELNWRGIAVEPLPEAFSKLQANRACDAVRGCVLDVVGPVRFMVLEGYTEMLSGVVDSYDARHLERIDREQASFGGTRVVISVPSFTLASLLERFGVREIDFLSVDTEGSELAVLRSMDVDRTTVRVITVENNYLCSDLWRLMVRNGYRLAAVLGCDEVYIRR
jgi:FkbM family methyltransferase